MPVTIKGKGVPEIGQVKSTPEVPTATLKKSVAPPAEPDMYADYLSAGPKEPVVDHLKAPITNASVEVTKTAWKNGEKVTEPIHKEEYQFVYPPHPLEKLCNLSVGGKRTVNLGNYESVQIYASLTTPCTKDNLEEAWEFAFGWVSDKIQSIVAEAKKGTT